MIEIVELEHRCSEGVTRAAIAPAWGANIVAFGYRQASWVNEVSALEGVGLERMASNPTSFGVPLLAPTPGRVGRNQDGRFHYRGREYAIEPTRHGLVRQVPWRLVAVSKSRVQCVAEIRVPVAGAPERFPFHFRASHEVTLNDRRLVSRLELRNLGEENQPLNVGWHPYLRRPPGRCLVQLPARKRWILGDGAEPTPTGELEAPESGRVFFGGRPIAERELWDDVFTDLESTDGIAQCWVESDESVALEAGGEQTVKVRRVVEVVTEGREGDIEPTPHVQLYTPPGREAISIEPLSSIPDAINLAGRGVEATGLCEVAPVGRVAFEVALRLEIA